MKGAKGKSLYNLKNGTVIPDLSAACLVDYLPPKTLGCNPSMLRYKVTVVVSYLPYPVVAGFLGSIGTGPAGRDDPWIMAGPTYPPHPPRNSRPHDQVLLAIGFP